MEGKSTMEKFDARASHKCYQKGKLAGNTRVLIIGGGPCGMRTAIEAQMLGAKVVVVEKRDRFSRNNVLHLWPFVIEDLRMLGAKKFFGKFCAGAIDHISIRQLQCILLKAALLLGVEVHTEVSFEKLIEPNAIEKTGWRAEIKPADHPVSQYEFDVIIGADGKRNTLQGFSRKEFRGKLAIAITANFINKKTEAEARVEEISGVAFIFNQKFFKELQEDTRIDLENIVYYKDDTHYFVMTAKKASLIEKGVIKQDLADTEKLLAPENVDREALQQYAIEAASFSTNYQMPNLEFAVNHYGQPDIAMFDFTSMYAAENASKVVERNGYRLLMVLVGDSLLEPFWPTGSGCARGFLSALDAAWSIRSWSLGNFTPLDVIAERESIYRLLAQTTPDNLNKDWKSYTVDPSTRYPNLNKAVVLPHQVVNLFITDNPASIEKMKRNAQDKPSEVSRKRRRGNVDNEILLSWLTDQLKEEQDITITDIGSVFKNGKVLCAIIHHYRPDLLDYNSVKDDEPAKNNQLAFDVLEKELGIPPVMTGEEITNTDDYLTMATYLTEVYDTFRGEIPHIKHPKLQLASKIPKSIIRPKLKSSCDSPNLQNKFPTLKASKEIIKNETDISKSILNSSKNSQLQLRTEKLSSNVSVGIYKSKNMNLSKSRVEVVFIKPNSKHKIHAKSSKSIRKPESLALKETSTDTRLLNISENKSKKKKIKCITCKKESISRNRSCIFQDDVNTTCNNNSSKKQTVVKNCQQSLQQEKTKTIKNFMTKLILAKKKSKLKRCNLSAISEAKSDLPENKMIEHKQCTLKPNTNCHIVELNESLKQIGNENEVSTQVDNYKCENLKIENNIHFYDVKAVLNKNYYLKNNFIQSGNLEKDVCQKLPLKNCESTKLRTSFCFRDFPSKDTLIKIRVIEKKPRNKFTLQKIEFVSSLNRLTVSSKINLLEKPFKISKLKISDDVRFNSKSSHNSYYKTNSPSGDFFKHSYSTWQQKCIPRIPKKLGSSDFENPLTNCSCQIKCKSHNHKFLSKKRTMNEGDSMHNQIYSRVSNWISSNDFLAQDNDKADTDIDTIITNSKNTDISSVSKMDQYDEVIVEERTDVVKFNKSGGPMSSQENFVEIMKNMNNNRTKSVKTLSKFSQYSPFQNNSNFKSASAPPNQFSVIVEGEEPVGELPESTKMSELSFKTIKTTNVLPISTQQSRPSSRHKRHIDMAQNKPCSIDKKTRKRRTLEKVGASVEERQKMLEEIASNRSERHNRRRQQRKLQTEQFVKSMQMLQANAPDSQPFEDYSIFLYRQTAPKFEDRVKDLEKQFTYIPDHDNKSSTPMTRGGGTDDDLAARIKSLENKWREPQSLDKKPKDLLRAIGKIETSDWNIKEIEKKINENKLGKPSKTFDKEKVPKWSKEQFLARQTKMEKQHLDRQDSAEAKYADIDKNIKHLDQKLKEGTVRELGTNKVASLTEKLVSKVPPEPKPPEKTVARSPVVLPVQGGSEFCHFCEKRVYLMERLSAEGKFFHHGCFKCQYCNTQLRLGSYAFDRDGQYGYKFFCLHHFGMVGEINLPKVARKPSQKLTAEQRRSPEKKSLTGITGVDLLDRVQTPERIEFSNPSAGHASSDQEESLSQMDEDEWTDKNFGASCAELADSDDDSSSLSDTDSDDEDAFDDALEEPVTKEGTMKWAERWKNSYSRKRHNSDSNGYSSSDKSSYYDSSDDDESDTATEGEEEIRARELRKQEVRVEPPVVQTDTGTDTEIVSDETSDSSSEIRNSATEISTDSEFAHDDPTPTRELPCIVLNDFNVTKTRGSGRNYPKKIQVTTGYLQRPSNDKSKRSNIELKLKPLVPPAHTVKKPAPILLLRTEGYSLNRTQSTGGIAAKVSLELKKKYLLGETAPGNIQKSGSASTLDTKFKTFQTTISDCQKLLKPAPEISASMQTFCNKLNERKSPILSPQSSIIFGKDIIKVDEQPKDTEVEMSSSNEPKIMETEEVAITTTDTFENVPEGRPRSPVHETSIVVPQIDWSKNNQSLSSDSLATSDSENDVLPNPQQFVMIPRVEVHKPNDEEEKFNIPPDSLCEPQAENRSLQGDNVSILSDAPKSITSEKKSLNQPKTLPNLETVLPDIHTSLHIKFAKSDRLSKEFSENENKSQKNSSGVSSPDSMAEQATAVLTETELSDWARDEVVSDDFEDVAFEINQTSENLPTKNMETAAHNAKMAKITEFENAGHICGNKTFTDVKNKTIITEAMNSILSANLDIEFMDTGTETSSDDGIVDSQDGYVLLKNEDEFAEDSLNPNINEIFEAKNVHINDKEIKNTGYCFITNDDSKTNNAVTDTKSLDPAKIKSNLGLNNDHDEDSLLIVETGTTTEENTFSDSTVKNVTEISADQQECHDKNAIIENSSSQKQRLEEKLAMVKAEAKLKVQTNLEQKQSSPEDNIEFEEHCQRLQSKVEFSNAKDSIDVRKSRRKSKSDSPQKPDLIQEERVECPKDILLNLSPTPHTPDILYNKDVIKKERDVNQRLIQEMVMNKMKAENKSLERKKRNRTVGSPSSPYSLAKSATTDIVSQINLNNLDKNNRKSIYSTSSSTYSTPDVLLSANLIPLQNSKSVNTIPEVNSTTKLLKDRPVSVFSTFIDEAKSPDTTIVKSGLQEARKISNTDEQFTPKAPPRQHRLNNDDINRKLEKLKQTAKMKDKKNKNVESQVQENTESLIINAERRNSWLYSNDTLNKKKNSSFRRSKSGDYEVPVSKPKTSLTNNNVLSVRTKSIPEIPKGDLSIQQINFETEREKMCKSDPNILEIDNVKPKKKAKDRERRKSITKLITTLFTKKSVSSSSPKGLFAKLSPKSKDMSKDAVVAKEPLRRNSFSEIPIQRNSKTPPPVPPLPLNYFVKGTDESSDGEHERRKDHSSCDTLDKLGTLEFSTSSNTGRRSSKAQRAARQAQLKRHRMAQEIQRKLEETEVKTKELETRGVVVEKALRGEDDGEYSTDDPELLQEWFDLMRDRTELRRYERELMVRAQELELEDRHARLQHDLRDRLENNDLKTEKELKIEEDIINEMMAIVAERDSLITVIEEDRLRYSNEDRDLEEQMLAKGLRLTPIKKSPEK